MNFRLIWHSLTRGVVAIRLRENSAQSEHQYRRLSTRGVASGGGQRAGASTAAGGARPCMARPWEQPGARADCPRGALPRNGRRRSCWRARVCVFQKKIKQPAPHPKASQKNSGQAARPHRGGRSDGLGARHALMMRRGNPAIASRVDSAARVARRKTSLGRQRGLPIASVRPLSRPARQMVCKTGIWPRVATNSSSWPPSSGVSLHRRQHLRHCHWSSVERARQTRRPERGGRCPAPCRGSPERGSTSLSEGRGRWPGWPAPPAFSARCAPDQRRQTMHIIDRLGGWQVPGGPRLTASVRCCTQGNMPRRDHASNNKQSTLGERSGPETSSSPPPGRPGSAHATSVQLTVDTTSVRGDTPAVHACHARPLL